MKVVPDFVKQMATILVLVCASLPALAFSENIFLDSTLSCNDLVHVSFDDECLALITPDMILEGGVGNTMDYSIEIEDSMGDPVSNPVPGIYIEETLKVTITHIVTNNSCWGEIILEDKTAPEIFCFNLTIPCFQSLNGIPKPPADDNCDSSPDVNLIEETIDNSDPCNGVIITRTYIAIDDQGNESQSCQQIITTSQPQLPDFPDDRLWTCGDYLNYNNVIEASPFTNDLPSTGSGVPDVAVGNYCPYNVTHSDITLPSCGESFKIIRTWTILNWCTNEILTTDINGDDNIQLIDVLDNLAPSIQLDAFAVSANVTGDHPQECTSEDFLLPAEISDECGTWISKIFTPVGEAIYTNGTDGSDGGYIPSPGLSLGFHNIIYEAVDECGNFDSLTVLIEVVDDIAPIVVCDELTEVALSIDGIAAVDAANFDDGSSDNCCLDYFEVRKMESYCENPQDTLFNTSVTFCCNDVSQSPLQLVVRAIDCAGNYNDCMVQVNVVDKINPELIHCPPSQTIDCDFYKDSLLVPLAINDYTVLNQFGNPIFFDNCQLLYTSLEVTENLNPCGEGTLTRFWEVTDPGFNPTVQCTQVIFVEHVSDWVVEFPEDVTVTCTDSLPDSGTPNLFFNTCELIAISFEDQHFTVVQDACFKVQRTWTVVNWCEVGPNISDEVVESSELELLQDCNGDGSFSPRVFQDGLNSSNFDLNAPLRGAEPDGYITYQQTIKVIDNTAPVIDCPIDLKVCITENDCWTTVELPLPDLLDCSDNLTLTAFGDLGTGLDPFEEVPPGNYSMTYSVMDNCGNSNACQFNIDVVDCKKPTPYCLNGLIIELGQNGTFDLWAIDLDAGSFDNCTDNLIYSFSADTSDQIYVLDCFNIGEIIITLWITDETGNQDYCETFVVIQDNMGACMGPPLIAGTVETEEGQGISDVEVKLSGDNAEDYLTIFDGHFEFDSLSEGGDFTITPFKDTNYINGVTTFDLVLISKHILGTVMLNSPYKIIAADVNQSKSVTTIDLVKIRRLILHIDDKFEDVPSWGFIDKDFVFPNPDNPFQTDFPPVIDINNLIENEEEADFIGFKMGDVNCSANPENFINNDDREGGTDFEISAKGLEVNSNEEFSLSFNTSHDDISGFQFTLNYDTEKLDFESFKESILGIQNIGLSKKEAGALTFSWNGELDLVENTLFELNFKAKQDCKIEEVISIGSRFTKAEAYSNTFELLDVVLQFEYPEFELFQNHPNPFHAQTTIAFNLPEGIQGTLSVWDASGKQLVVITKEFHKGLNKETIYLNPKGSGLLFYQLTTPKHSEVKKMVLIN